MWGERIATLILLRGAADGVAVKSVSSQPCADPFAHGPSRLAQIERPKARRALSGLITDRLG